MSTPRRRMTEAECERWRDLLFIRAFLSRDHFTPLQELRYVRLNGIARRQARDRYGPRKTLARQF